MKNFLLSLALFLLPLVGHPGVFGPTGGSSSSTPAASDLETHIRDELCGGVQDVPAGWAYSCSDSGCTGLGTSGVDTTGHAQCVTEITSNTPSDGRGALLRTGLFYFGGSWVNAQAFRLKLHTASTAGQPYRATIGLATDDHWQQGGLGTAAMGFRYSESNSRKWQCVLRYSSSDVITTDTGITGDTSYHIFGLTLNSSTSTITWTIDGVTVCTDTTHFPVSTILTEAGVKVENTGGGTDAHKMSIDYFDLDLSRATAR